MTKTQTQTNGSGKKRNPVTHEDYIRWEGEQKADSLQTMGRKKFVAYGLYLHRIHVTPDRARRNNFTYRDLGYLIEALACGWDLVHSSSKTGVSFRKAVIFKHSSPLGNAASKTLFNLVEIEKNFDGIYPTGPSDYSISVNSGGVPSQVSIFEIDDPIPYETRLKWGGAPDESELDKPVAERFDIMLFVDVKNANPNGDPENGNTPRINFETDRGQQSDARVKYVLRHYISCAEGNKAPFAIIIQKQTNLDRFIAEAIQVTLGAEAIGRGRTKSDIELAQKWLFANFWDVRAFGGTLSSGPNAGQIHGACQVGWGESIDQIQIIDAQITRCCVAEHKDIEGSDSEEIEAALV